MVFEPQVARLSPLPPLSGAIGLLLGLVVCALGFVEPAPTVELFGCRHVTGWDGLAAHFGIPCNNGLQWLPSLFAAGRVRPCEYFYQINRAGNPNLLLLTFADSPSITLPTLRFPNPTTAAQPTLLSPSRHYNPRTRPRQRIQLRLPASRG